MANETSVLSALLAALEATDPAADDEAAVALAKSYAAELDAGGCPQCGGRFERLEKIGPKLLAALEQLRMTPKARTAVMRGGTSDGTTGPSALDELRRRRENRTTAVDPPAS